MGRTLRNILIAIVALIVLAGGCTAYQYNRLVALDQKVKAAWAQVENVLKRRADLIPNLVSTVKGYMKHEKEIFKMIADARAKLAGAKNPAEAAAADAELRGALSRLIAIAESNPQLRANENFLRLQDELAGTENRIAVERRRYNLAVEEYNRTVKSFPTVIFARLFNFPLEKPYFRVEKEEEKEVPKVEF